MISYEYIINRKYDRNFKFRKCQFNQHSDGINNQCYQNSLACIQQTTFDRIFKGLLQYGAHLDEISHFQSLDTAPIDGIVSMRNTKNSDHGHFRVWAFIFCLKNHLTMHSTVTWKRASSLFRRSWCKSLDGEEKTSKSICSDSIRRRWCPLGCRTPLLRWQLPENLLNIAIQISLYICIYIRNVNFYLDVYEKKCEAVCLRISTTVVY